MSMPAGGRHFNNNEDEDDWSPRSGEKETYAKMIREEFEAAQKHLDIEGPWEGVERNQGSITSSEGPRYLSGEHYDTDEGPIGSELYEPIMSEEEARIRKLQETIRDLEQLASPGLKIRELERRVRDLEQLPSPGVKICELEEKVCDLELKNMDHENRISFLEKVI